jgi:tripartite-type tricarboxylate transporter receptor subunit TctC
VTRLLLAVASFTWIVAANAQPVRFVVPYAPGGVNDVVARVLAPEISNRLGRPVVIDNRPGGGTVIGTQVATKAAPDGNTILLINPTTAINVSTFKSLPYDVLQDLAPIGTAASYPNLFVVPADSPAKDLREFIAMAKAQPGKLNYASGGNGGFTHLAGELFKTMTGTDLVHVPYKGSASTITPLLSNDVAMTIGDPPTYLPLLRTGKLRALAVTSERRYSVVPNVPTMKEAGLPGYQADTWLAIVAPARTPAPAIERLNAALRESLGVAAVKERLLAQGLEPFPGTPQELGTLLKTEIEKWAKTVSYAGITPE